MFPAFNFLEWLEGALQEEREAASAASPVCCPLPSPGSPTWLDGSPVSREAQPPTPNEAPPGEESGAPASGSGNGGEASSGTWEGPVERLQPLATESNWTGVNEWREQESTSAPSGDSFPPPPVKTGPRQQPKKKAGASFSSEQRKALENIFQKQYYVTVPEAHQLALLLDLSITQVKIWFQNRRMKFKRELKELRQSFQHSVPFSSYNPGVPPNVSQDFSVYPQQMTQPFTLDLGLQCSSPCPLYQSSLNPPRPLCAPRLPYPYPTQLSVHPVAQYEVNYMPYPSSA